MESTNIPQLLFYLIVAGLATYRLSRMVAKEEGPGIPFGDKEARKFGVFVRIRMRIDSQQETWIGRGINCPLCLSFWFGLVISLLLLLPFGWVILFPLAVSGFACSMYKMEPPQR